MYWSLFSLLVITIILLINRETRNISIFISYVSRVYGMRRKGAGLEGIIILITYVLDFLFTTQHPQFTPVTRIHIPVVLRSSLVMNK